MVAFEAAVAGGIPIIKALREGLTANRIEWAAGIINGTTNFILRDARQGPVFDTVLKKRSARLRRSRPDLRHRRCRCRAQGDVDPAIAFGIPVSSDKATSKASQTRSPPTSVRRTAWLPHQAARHRQARQKGVELRVHPTLIPAKRLIANVEGAMNAVLVKGDAVGADPAISSAGAEPTACR